MNCLVADTATLGAAGVTEIELNVAEVTVNWVLPDVAPEVAVIVVVPAAAPVATPAVLTVATPVSDELQVTDAVISPVVPSEYVPMAVNCWVASAAMVWFAGVTAID